MSTQIPASPIDLAAGVDMLRVEIAVLRDKADRLCGAYSGLARAAATTVDDRGAPLTPAEALAAIRAWLDQAGTALGAADDELGEALRLALRLAPTEESADRFADVEAGADLPLR